MKQVQESFCTSCQWHGDGEGITSCPLCGLPITALDVNAPEASEDLEEYPEELIKESEEEDEYANL